MRVEVVTRPDDWQIIKDNALFTIHKTDGGVYPTPKWKKKILMAEHSPVRSGHIIINCYDVPSFVIGHIVRHNIGFTPFVATLRNDRTEYDTVPDRNTPNSLRFDGNFQAFINISRKRLCGQASKETRDFWNMVLAAVAEHEPELYYHCVPECIYRGGCPEFTMCQGAVWSQFVMKQVADSNDLDCFLSINKRYDAWHRFKNR